jgi:hypothetical protein|tara:strand:- start:2447 stop:5158 length:2712 start_codon:yes stop_codon:yes gene_type:complete
MASVFVSPGVYTKVQDFTAFASRVGITRLGIVGRFPKGPAFEAIAVPTSEERYERFGSTNYNYPATYVADAFLSQSNELTISRVLGKSGFTNSGAWLVIADISETFSGTSTTSGLTFTDTGLAASTTYTYTFAEDVALGDGEVSVVVASPAITINFSGSITTADIISEMESTSDYTDLGITSSVSLETTYADADAETMTLAVVNSEPKGSKSGSTLAVLRSKKNQITGNFYFDDSTDISIGAIGSPTNPLTDFVLSGSTGPLTAQTNGYTVSVDETKSSYVATAFGKSAKVISGLENMYVESIYPHFTREAFSRGEITGINPSLVYVDTDPFTSYSAEYTNAKTPWIVSRVIGGTVRNLFKVHTVSDGNSSNREVKVSFANIDINNNRFDLIVRRYEYGDSAGLGQSSYERFSNLELNENSSNYIGRVIGTFDKVYDQVSKYVTIEMAEAVPTDTVPAGFRGYEVRNVVTGATTSQPNIYYKTSYLSGDSTSRTYMGVSELGYESITKTQVTVKTAAQNIEHDLFAYAGSVTSDKTTLKGFHMEGDSDSSLFDSGDIASMTGYTDPSGLYVDRAKLKFTVAPYGGFDGWDKTNVYNNPYERFTDVHTSDVQSFKDALDIFESDTKVDINLLSTPDIDYSNNLSICRYALEIVEDRADSLYIMDSPRISDTNTNANNAVLQVISSFEATGFDSSYATTYWPWLKTEDTSSNGRIVFLSPTFGVVRAIAFTDNKYNPWYAPAGALRGALPNNVKKPEVVLSRNNLDDLYNARINPIAFFTQQGTLIWGQKTMQVVNSALDRISVRRLVLRLQRLVSAASFSLVFDPNDETLKDQFKAKVEPILLQIQNQRGIHSFKVVMDDSNNTAETMDRLELIGKIQVKPTRAAEYIDLTFQLLPTGASFDDF